MPEERTTPEPNPAGPTGAPSKPSNLAKLKILLFVFVVIVAECAVAYLYLPSSAEPSAMAKAPAESKAAEGQSHAEALPDEEPVTDSEGPADQVEVDLGQFSVTQFQPASNTTMRIDFHLYGTVGAHDQEEFLKRKEENLHRFREQVIVTLRSADMSDLSDAGLGLIKRGLLEKSNKIFGKPSLRGIVFSDFSFFEQ